MSIILSREFILQYFGSFSINLRNVKKVASFYIQIIDFCILYGQIVSFYNFRTQLQTTLSILSFISYTQNFFKHFRYS